MSRAIAVWSATIVVLAQTPSGEGVSTESPAIEEQTPNSSSSSKASPPENAIPVRIIEDPIEAEHRKEREAKSDQHESDDLAAQRKAADAAWKGAIAAERQINPAWWQVGFAALGTVLLIYTLWLTRKSVEITGVIDEHLGLWVFGEITYRDAFNFERKTCFRLVCIGQGFSLGLFKACEEGNSYT